MDCVILTVILSRFVLPPSQQSSACFLALPLPDVYSPAPSPGMSCCDSKRHVMQPPAASVQEDPVALLPASDPSLLLSRPVCSALSPSAPPETLGLVAPTGSTDSPWSIVTLIPPWTYGRSSLLSSGFAPFPPSLPEYHRRSLCHPSPVTASCHYPFTTSSSTSKTPSIPPSSIIYYGVRLCLARGGFTVTVCFSYH